MIAQHSSRERTAAPRFALNYFCLFAVFAVVTIYLQAILRARGFSKSQIGFIQAAIETVGILSPPLWGWFSDHSRHRRGVLTLAVLGAGASFLCFGTVAAFAPALAVAVAFGFFNRPIIPLTDGLVLRYLAEHGGDYGRPRTAGSFAFIIIAASVELLGAAGETKGLTVILSAMAACTLLHAAAVRALPLTERERSERAGGPKQRRHFDWSVLLSRPFVVFAAVAFVGRFGITGYYGFFTLFLKEEIGFPQAGLLWLLGPLSEIPIIFFSGAIIRRIGSRNLFALGIAGMAARLTGYAFAPNVWAIIPLQFLHCLTFGAYHTASIHYINRIVPSDMKQSAVAVFSAISLGVTAIAGNAIGGVLIDHFGFRVMYGSYGLVAAIAAVCALVFVKEPDKREEENEK